MPAALVRRNLTVIFVAGLITATFAALLYHQRDRLREGLLLHSEIREVAYPRNNQVTQRDPSGNASVPVRLRLGRFTESVEYALLSQEESELPPERWKRLPGTISGTVFEGALPLTTGWHHLYLRSKGELYTVPGPRIRLAVGEVFVIAGQSNALGTSHTRFATRSNNVYTGHLQPDGTIDWRIGNDPQARGGAGSVWPIVGDALSNLLAAPVGFINVAVGGSSVMEWQPGTSANRRLRNALLSLKPSGPRAILWHQGESDHHLSATQYYEALKTLIEDSRSLENISPQIPWLVAQASYQPHYHNSDPVREAQARLWKEGLALPGPDTDPLRKGFREPSDGIHFNAAGTRKAAALWLESLRKALPGTR